MQITRQRVRQALHDETEEGCPTCMGSGKARPSMLLTDEIEEKLDILVNKMGQKRVILQLHPYVAAYLKKGFYSLLWRWRIKYTWHLKIAAVQDLGFLHYNFLDPIPAGIEVSTDAEMP